MRKHPLQRYREHGYRFPRVAWLMDRSFVYVATAIAAVAVVGVSLYSGYSSLQRVLAEPVEDSPYAELIANNSPALTWGAKMAQWNPANLEAWEAEKAYRPDAIVPATTCRFSEPVSASTLGTFNSGNGSVKTRVSVYSAGMARSDFDARIKELEECTGGHVNKDAPGTPVVWDSGFAFTLGDAVVTVTGDAGLLSAYEQYARETLVQSSCAAIDVPSGSSVRNLYADAGNYTGLLQTDMVKNRVPVDRMPQFKLENLSDLNDNSIPKPESPLPSGFPDSLPTEVAKPTLPTPVEQQDSFEVDATYQIADTTGPGCGWHWSALQSPGYDVDALNAAKTDALNKAQADSDAKATAYVDQYRNYALAQAVLAPAVRSWNEYVTNRGQVEEKWAWLNKQRELIKPAYLAYVEAHDAWINFDNQKAKVSKEYEDELKTCKDKQEELLEWERKYGNITPAPTAPVPPKPEGCVTMPVRPAILDQVKGEEPKMPSIPADVTIPQSWPKPKTQPDI